LRPPTSPLFPYTTLFRSHNAVHQVAQGIVIQRQSELAGFDLGEIEHVVDQPEQMPPVHLQALQHCARLLGYLAIDTIKDKLRIADRKSTRLNSSHLVISY